MTSTVEPKRILVVEDDPLYRDVLADILLAEGYQVAVAANGVDALRQARKATPDLIVLDLHLPLMNGRQFMGVYCEESPGADVPVLLISGCSDLQVAAAAWEVDAAFAKPFPVDEFVDTVHRFAATA